jgi:hypothetical protein
METLLWLAVVGVVAPCLFGLGVLALAALTEWAAG